MTPNSLRPVNAIKPRTGVGGSIPSLRSRSIGLESIGARGTLPLSRRSWIARIGGLTLLLARLPSSNPTHAVSPIQDPTKDLTPRETFLSEARSAGLGEIRTYDTERFTCLGDAKIDFIKEASQLCEAIARDYERHFQNQGFTLSKSTQRMTVIILGGPDSYQKLLKRDPGPFGGGLYEIDKNRLVLCDARTSAPDVPPRGAAGRTNTFVLAHEMMHLLTFNTGLLHRLADIPLAISEGLATYGEVRKTKDRSELGLVNRLRLQAMAIHFQNGGEWFSLERLLREDGLFQDAASEQMAYAEAWVLIHELMIDRGRRDGFRDYLATLATRKESGQRIPDASKHLGDLDRLDALLKQTARRFIRSLGS